MNGWVKKGKYLYEHDLMKWWMGIRKIKVTSDEWMYQVKNVRGDVIIGEFADTQKEILRKATGCMKVIPSKIQQHNFMVEQKERDRIY